MRPPSSQPSAYSSSCIATEPPRTIGCARAAFDFKCPRDKVLIEFIDERTRGVRACGNRATYVSTCTDLREHSCAWIMNNESRPVE